MTRYKIVRFYQNRERETVRGKSGLTLAEAQQHCKDPQTSSRTCTNASGKARTKRFGPWFEGYMAEEQS